MRCVRHYPLHSPIPAIAIRLVGVQYVFSLRDSSLLAKSHSSKRTCFVVLFLVATVYVSMVQMSAEVNTPFPDVMSHIEAKVDEASSTLRDLSLDIHGTANVFTIVFKAEPYISASRAHV